MPVDRLSALPDGILCYILSFLQTREAAITCLLSKRWQFLWTELPYLLFEDDCSWEMEDFYDFVIQVHRTLVTCSRHNLEGFEVNFKHGYDQIFASDVDVWIGFAVKNKVKEFMLLLPGKWKCFHMLPQTMYFNKSWTSLTLEGCIMAPPGTIQWPSLTTLWLGDVILNDHTLEKILSGCPVLSSLGLDFCNGFSRVEANSPSLRMLTVNRSGEGDDLKISAPYVHTLKIDLFSSSIKLCLENIKSLARAEIDVYGWQQNDTEFGKKSAEQLFASIRHVKILELGTHFIKFILSITSKWQFLQSTRGCLDLHTYHGDKSISAIVALLKSSPNLETLVIHVDRFYYDWDAMIPNSAPKPVPKYDLDCDLFHLKSVCFKILEDPRSDTDEPLLTLARILLERAIVLDKMVVDFQGCTSSSAQTTSYEMARKLLSYPRSSPKAVVLFC